MSSLNVAPLTDRGVVRVAGPDAARLLQGLITADLARIERQPAVFAGLLTPQGKILFDFLVVKAGQGFLLETAGDKSADLSKRLTFYKLRADVAISDVSGEYGVAALWGGPVPAIEPPASAFQDPRLTGLGWRGIAPAPFSWVSGIPGATAATDAEYHAHRIALGVPEGGRDYVLGDTFPHEALFDQLGGVDFAKGCYVGQEVVSRMEHRSTARKRVVPVVGSEPLQSGAEVKAGEAVIGSVGSVAGSRGLALLRLDRVGEAQGKGQPITAGGIPVMVELPPWVRFGIPVRDGTAKV
ncbi:MAG: folate-binding protein [Hyphomicrobiaceae bacterium]|nr:folate-binding protein [Hyphomicrobiaceae bacterium]